MVNVISAMLLRIAAKIYLMLSYFLSTETVTGGEWLIKNKIIPDYRTQRIG